LWLAEQGKTVTVLEIRPVIDTGAFAANEMMLVDLLADRGVELMVDTSIIEATSSGQLLLGGLHAGEKLEYDDVVAATGLQPNLEAYHQLKDQVAEVYNVGDSQRPRRIKDAIWEAFLVACSAGDRSR
jgi:2-enoate reductase